MTVNVTLTLTPSHDTSGVLCSNYITSRTHTHVVYTDGTVVTMVRPLTAMLSYLPYTTQYHVP